MDLNHGNANRVLLPAPALIALPGAPFSQRFEEALQVAVLINVMQAAVLDVTKH